MSKIKIKGQDKLHDKSNHVFNMAFGKDNYKWMLIGLGIIVLGFVLMAGKTDDLFNSGDVFRGGDVSFSTKIKVTYAPIIVLLGFVVEVYAILKNQPAENEPA